MKRIFLVILFVSFSVSYGQWKKSGGKLVVNDTTLTVKVKKIEQDSAVTAWQHYVPFFVETGTGSAWMAAAYRQNWYVFTVDAYFEADSVGWLFYSSLAATDSFRVGLYQMSDSTRIAQTTWGSPNSTSNNTLFYQTFDTPPMLSPGRTYAIMFSHNTNTTLPVVDQVTNARFYYELFRARFHGYFAPGAWFEDFPSTLSGSLLDPFTPQYVPVFVLRGGNYTP